MMPYEIRSDDVILAGRTREVSLDCTDENGNCQLKTKLRFVAVLRNRQFHIIGIDQCGFEYTAMAEYGTPLTPFETFQVLGYLCQLSNLTLGGDAADLIVNIDQVIRYCRSEPRDPLINGLSQAECRLFMEGFSGNEGWRFRLALEEIVSQLLLDDAISSAEIRWLKSCNLL